MSVMAMNGLAFDLTTPQGPMMATIIAGIADFERELIQERICSGIAAAKARGERLGANQAEIRPACVEGDGARRKGTQLSLDRARGGAEQEHRGRYRQTSPRQRNSDRLTATLRLVT